MTTVDLSLPAEIVQEMLNDMPIGILISDIDDNIQWGNKAFQDFTGSNIDLLKGKNKPKFEQSHFHSLDDQENVFHVDKEKPARWLKRHEINVPGPNKTVFKISTYTDITEQKDCCDQLQNQLDELSTIDHVSGLLNQRAMLQNLEPLVSRSRRYQNPLSVIAMDVMNLDVVKDQYGQDAVDYCVKELSFLLKDQLRWADLVCRSGENQFIFILPETDKPSSVHLAKKLNDRIQELTIHYKGHEPFSLDVSLGVAAWEKGNDSILLLRNAKQSLEVAKSRGAGSVQDC
ncbi:MAG: diguanylate cyclase [Gammaproteobacteria bacterium]|nr:diguanylate cyclase [Gammaproteobacteria bacterium]MDH5803263.1 diguanylate cyclase [Gammaproteobacteria bacterium]